MTKSEFVLHVVVRKSSWELGLVWRVKVLWFHSSKKLLPEIDGALFFDREVHIAYVCDAPCCGTRFSIISVNCQTHPFLLTEFVDFKGVFIESTWGEPSTQDTIVQLLIAEFGREALLYP